MLEMKKRCPELINQSADMDCRATDMLARMLRNTGLSSKGIIHC